MMSNDTAAQPQAGPPPEAVLTQIGFGALMSQALCVTAKLGLADLLEDGPKHADELAAATDTHAGALYRVLRALASIGVFQETEPKVFALTPLGDALRSDAPNSMRNGLIFMGEEWHWRVWGQFMHSVKTGAPAWKHALSEDVFDYFRLNPEAGEIFNNAMTDMTLGTAPPIVASYDFSGFGTLADIAGGHGYLLAKILQANPGLQGILFDLPHVLAGADAILTREGVADRVEKISGDFFQSVPPADAYIMKHIIHDWNDEDSIRLLRSLHAALNEGGKVLIVETVVPEGNEPHYAKLLDLEMLVSPGGIERTAAEYAALLAAAGFRLTRIVPTPSAYSIVEGVKA
jgi:hypothetical protein